MATMYNNNNIHILENPCVEESSSSNGQSEGSKSAPSNVRLKQNNYIIRLNHEHPDKTLLHYVISKCTNVKVRQDTEATGISTTNQLVK